MCCAINVCPAGSVLKEGGGGGNSSVHVMNVREAYTCVCKPGFGEVGGICRPCPQGYWSAGDDFGPCKSCVSGAAVGAAAGAEWVWREWREWLVL
jgi:hypothetical protein